MLTLKGAVHPQVAKEPLQTHFSYSRLGHIHLMGTVYTLQWENAKCWAQPHWQWQACQCMHTHAQACTHAEQVLGLPPPAQDTHVLNLCPQSHPDSQRPLVFFIFKLKSVQCRSIFILIKDDENFTGNLLFPGIKTWIYYCLYSDPRLPQNRLFLCTPPSHTTREKRVFPR